MNARNWRKAGYHTLFRDERDGFNELVVILVDKTTGEARFKPVARGRWMDTDSFDAFEPTALTPKMKDALRSCYCDSACDVCDFCAGRRSDFPTGPWKKPLAWEAAA